MASNTIILDDYQSLVSVGEYDVPFPTIFRLTGFEGSYDESTGELTATKEPGKVCYSLSANATAGLLNCTATPIRGFDPMIDTGWLIVRHYGSQGLAEGYLDCIMDNWEEESPLTVPDVIYQTKRGFFTLMRRMPTPGCPNHLVMYITKVLDHSSNNWVDSYTIILPDGSISQNPDEFLFSPK